MSEDRSQKPPLILLDLEETLIESWRERYLLPNRVEQIKNFLAEHSDAELGLMSWAVYDDKKDLKDFKEDLQEWLEGCLDFKFTERWVLSMDGWADELFKTSKKKIDRSEMFDIFGKEEVFLMLARRHPEWSNRKVVLFDDAVEHCILDLPDRNNSAQMFNVKKHKIR